MPPAVRVGLEKAVRLPAKKACSPPLTGEMGGDGGRGGVFGARQLSSSIYCFNLCDIAYRTY